MNKWEEDQKVDMVRKVFQTALCIPLINIEQLWKDYDSFENQVNRMTVIIYNSLVYTFIKCD
jgi:cleavage stimulation factor subunit 3